MKLCIFILFAVFAIILSSCRENYNKDDFITLESQKFKTDSIVIPDSVLISNESSRLKDFISRISDKSAISIKWSDLNTNNQNLIISELLNKRIVVPLFKNQLNNIRNSSLTDTSIVFLKLFGGSSFIFELSGGESNIKNIPSERNALIVLKIKNIESAKKLYLVKKTTDYLHKEQKVTEYVIKCEYLEIYAIDISSKTISSVFQIVEF